jgi:hypothetical protein
MFPRRLFSPAPTPQPDLPATPWPQWPHMLTTFVTRAEFAIYRAITGCIAMACVGFVVRHFLSSF